MHWEGKCFEIYWQAKWSQNMYQCLIVSELKTELMRKEKTCNSLTAKKVNNKKYMLHVHRKDRKSHSDLCFPEHEISPDWALNVQIQEMPALHNATYDVSVSGFYRLPARFEIGYPWNVPAVKWRQLCHPSGTCDVHLVSQNEEQYSIICS